MKNEPEDEMELVYVYNYPWAARKVGSVWGWRRVNSPKRYFSLDNPKELAVS